MNPQFTNQQPIAGKNNSKLKPLMYLSMVLMMAGAGIGAVWLLNEGQASPEISIKSATPAPTSKAPSILETPDLDHADDNQYHDPERVTYETQDYESTRQQFSITIPNDWLIQESEEEHAYTTTFSSPAVAIDVSDQVPEPKGARLRVSSSKELLGTGAPSVDDIYEQEVTLGKIENIVYERTLTIDNNYAREYLRTFDKEVNGYHLITIGGDRLYQLEYQYAHDENIDTWISAYLNTPKTLTFED